jgi:hypothetical protein
MANSDAALHRLVITIAVGDAAEVSTLLSEVPQLARTHFESTNATRQSAKENLVAAIGKYIYRGDTALHFAAAAHNPKMVGELISRGADVRAKNRLGDEPLHCAAAGDPASARWNPASQAAVISSLIEAGADPNAPNKMGVAPLHKAVRTRCAEAVRTLLARGADPAQKNRSGSTPMLLAKMNTGRGGSGSPEAKAQQVEIISLLEEKLQKAGSRKQ